MKVTTRWDAAGDPIPDQNKVWFPDFWILHAGGHVWAVIFMEFPPKWTMLDTARVQNQTGRIVKLSLIHI